jgi:hypothetical protein
VRNLFVPKSFLLSISLIMLIITQILKRVTSFVETQGFL